MWTVKKKTMIIRRKNWHRRIGRCQQKETENRKEEEKILSKEQKIVQKISGSWVRLGSSLSRLEKSCQKKEA